MITSEEVYYMGQTLITTEELHTTRDILFTFTTEDHTTRVDRLFIITSKELHYKGQT